jgi:uncharacterized protein (DUF1800 family)
MLKDPRIAAIRFGLGPRPEAAVPAAAQAWLAAQLHAAPPAPCPDGWVRPPTVAEALAEWQADRENPLPPGQPSRQARLFEAEVAAWLGHCIGSVEPFRDRLVQFWANHFTVSRRNGYVSVLGGAYLREAIAPHVTGRFADLLFAAITHPAMLSYLDNQASVGPNSEWGRRNRRGLNENLAREILELHTLSPAAGYTQADVTAFAALLTGWHVETRRAPLGTVFRPGAHEPGEKRLLGRSFREGPEALREALDVLAGHPATHHFLASKLARHFIADTPPAGVVEHLAGILAATDGDLAAVARALIELPEAWEPLTKFRTPLDWVLAAHRALGANAADGAQAARALAALGQPPLAAPAPDGWPDAAAAWASPEAVMQRLDWSYFIAGRYARTPPADALATALGPLAGEPLRRAVGGAGAARDAIALILASAEFQRR